MKNKSMMISFYPGPSRVHEEIPDYVKEAYREGILSINHRSEEFMSMSEKTISLLKNKLEIPKNYSVFYTTSATECWEIIAQSLSLFKSRRSFQPHHSGQPHRQARKQDQDRESNYIRI